MTDPAQAALPISLDRASRSFASGGGQIDALGPLDLDVAAGSFTVVIGPNGCGKSTLLRLIAGLLPPTSGRVVVGDQEPRAGDGRVGIVFQQPRLVPWRSVLDNVALPMEIAGLPVGERRGRAAQALSRVGLETVGRLRPRELSGGMAQRAALARALVDDPPVLLLDEPFSALDALTRETFDLELQRLWLDRRRTIVLVTHSVAEAVALADQVVVLSPRPGRLARLVEVDLPRPRPALLAGDPQAAGIAAEVRDALASTHAIELRPWSEAEEIPA